MLFPEKKAVRKSTTAKSAQTAQRVKERTSAQEKRAKKTAPSDIWKPTQEELLEEAKITEQENLKSLGKFLLCITV